MAISYTTKNKSLILINASTGTATSNWFILPRSKVFSCSGITTAGQVVYEYITFEGETPKTLFTSTADETKENNQALHQVRARISVANSDSNPITVAVCYDDDD